MKWRTLDENDVLPSYDTDAKDSWTRSELDDAVRNMNHAVSSIQQRGKKGGRRPKNARYCRVCDMRLFEGDSYDRSGLICKPCKNQQTYKASLKP